MASNKAIKVALFAEVNSEINEDMINNVMSEGDLHEDADEVVESIIALNDLAHRDMLENDVEYRHYLKRILLTLMGKCLGYPD